MIAKGYFFIELSPTDLVDLGTLKVKDWHEVQRRAKIILEAKQTQNEKVAFVAAFLNLMTERQAMLKPFNMDA